MSDKNSNNKSAYTMLRVLDDKGHSSAYITILNPNDYTLSADTSSTGSITTQLVIQIAGANFDKLAKNWLDMSTKTI
jgi:hypothetical protein